MTPESWIDPIIFTTWLALVASAFYPVVEQGLYMRQHCIIMAYWKEVLVIPEDAIILPTQYIEVE